MFYYKVSFLIVLMLSVVCFSPPKSAEEEKRIAEKKEKERQENIERCLAEVKKVFGVCTMAINCIRKAILYMKLYGNFAFSYTEHVVMYYEYSHLNLRYDSIELPHEFCKNSISCLEETIIFQETPTHEDISSKFTPDEMKLLDHSLSQVKVPEETFEPSSSKSSKNIDRLKSNILKNALYHHVIYNLPAEINIPHEAKRYFHRTRSHGYYYLHRIAKVVDTVSDNVSFPALFCQQLYKKTEEKKENQNVGNNTNVNENKNVSKTKKLYECVPKLKDKNKNEGKNKNLIEYESELEHQYEDKDDDDGYEPEEEDEDEYEPEEEDEEEYKPKYKNKGKNYKNVTPYESELDYEYEDKNDDDEYKPEEEDEEEYEPEEEDQEEYEPKYKNKGKNYKNVTAFESELDYEYEDKNDDDEYKPEEEDEEDDELEYDSVDEDDELEYDSVDEDDELEYDSVDEDDDL